MKNVYLNHSRARAMAASLWGTVNHSYRTNRSGCFYFSCSGHGGYVIDGNALTDEEYAAVTQYIAPDIAKTVVKPGGDMRGMLNPFARGGSRTSRYLGDVVVDTPIIVAEEDCAWAILEHLTAVAVTDKGLTCTPGERKEAAAHDFTRYYAPIMVGNSVSQCDTRKLGNELQRYRPICGDPIYTLGWKMTDPNKIYRIEDVEAVHGLLYMAHETETDPDKCKQIMTMLDRLTIVMMTL